VGVIISNLHFVHTHNLALVTVKEVECYFIFVYFQHWIRMEMQPDMLVHSLKMTVDPSDSSYTPSLVVVSGGDSFTAMNELATVNIRNTDTVVSLLSDSKEVRMSFLCLLKQGN
jgi:hypothetical protein